MIKFLGLILAVSFVATTAYEPYDYNTEMCCSGNVIKGYDADTGCCASGTYNYRTERCCGNTVKSLSEAEGSLDCCYHQNEIESQFYDRDTQICCDGYVREMPADDADNADYTCCGAEVINSETQLCCGNEIMSRSADQACCGSELYNESSQICCQGGRMENGRYVMDYAIYEQDPLHPSCCGLYPINWQTQVCCYDRPSLDKPADAKDDEYFSCCGDTLITDYATQICCNDVVHERVNNTYCCDDKSLYDADKEICCGGQVYDMTGNENLLCCWGADQLYDSTTEMCCGNEGGVVSLAGQTVSNTTICCY